MKCNFCNKEATINLPLMNLCKNCFLRIIEKRIRKYSRINKIFRKGDKILVSDSLCEILAKKITKDLPMEIFSKKNKKINKIIIPWTMDDEIEQFLSYLFYAKKLKKAKGIKFLREISDQEAELFAELNRVKFDPKPNKKIKNFIDSLEKKYPEIRYSLSSSIKQIK